MGTSQADLWLGLTWIITERSVQSITCGGFKATPGGVKNIGGVLGQVVVIVAGFFRKKLHNKFFFWVLWNCLGNLKKTFWSFSAKIFFKTKKLFSKNHTIFVWKSHKKNQLHSHSKSEVQLNKCVFRNEMFYSEIIPHWIFHALAIMAL